MPNPIKYSASPQTLALKKGNFWIGTGDSDKGPTSTTGYWNGITPVTGGYSVYINRPSGEFAVYNPANDSELITVTRNISGTTFATGPSALNWYNSQTDYMCLNIDYPPIVTNGLVLNLDAGFTPSFPKYGTSWYDISPSTNLTTLINGPSYSFAATGGGTILFDGTDDYATVSNESTYDFTNAVFSLDIWFKQNGTSGNSQILINKARYGVNGRMLESFIGTNATIVIGTYNVGWTFIGWDGPVLLNRWYNLIVVSNGGNALMYINGSQVATNSGMNTSLANTSDPIDIGGYPGGSSLLGNISSARIYNRALNTSEVLQNYQAMFPRFLGENIIMSGLFSYLDAGYLLSYPGSGTSWNDVSGNGNNGTLTNGPSYSSGSIVFDGTDDSVFLPNNFISFPSLTTFTISVWFKSTQSTGGTIFGQQNTNTPNGAGGWVPVIYLRSDGTIRIEPFWTGSTSNVLTNTVPLNNNVWHNVTTTYNNGTNQLYVDGSYVTQATGLSLVSYASIYYYIIGAGYSSGRGLGTNFFSGSISNFSFYTRSLSSSEISQNYNAQKGRFGL